MLGRWRDEGAYLPSFSASRWAIVGEGTIATSIPISNGIGHPHQVLQNGCLESSVILFAREIFVTHSIFLSSKQDAWNKNMELRWQTKLVKPPLNCECSIFIVHYTQHPQKTVLILLNQLIQPRKNPITLTPEKKRFNLFLHRLIWARLSPCLNLMPL